MMWTSLMMGASAAPATIALTDHAFGTGTKATWTFPSRALGAAASDRRVVVGVTASQAVNNNTVSSVTIAGVAATQHVYHEDGTGAASRAALWSAPVPTGTTGDVVVTFASADDRCGIGIWRMTGAGASPVSTHADGTDGTGTTSITVPAGGVAVAMAATSASTTWSGLTEDFDETIAGTSLQSGACAAFAAAQTGLSVSDTNNRELVVAVFGPV